MTANTITGYLAGLRRDAVMLASAVAIAGTAHVSRAAAADIVIGVISPTGVGRSIGRAHEETIRFAIDRHGSIDVGGVDVPIRLVPKSDRGDPQKAVAAAQELKEAGAVAILGPVDSNSTKAVLDAKLGIPVLSALSTAPVLSTTRDPWFFRVTLADDERMRHYAATLHREKMAPPPVLVVYEPDQVYSEGLRTALLDALELPAEVAVPLPAAEVARADASAAEVTSDDVPTTALDQKIAPPPRTVFVLGRSSWAVQTARTIERRLRAASIDPLPTFFFVGADGELRTGAPEGSYSIGEPFIPETNVEAMQLQAEFAQEQDVDAGDFVVTAYEAAYYVLPQALTEALRTIAGDAATSPSNGEPPQQSLDRLREAVRQRLEDDEFQSLEPWRRIRLHGGALDGGPVVPVYRITRRLDLVAIPQPKPWLDVHAPAEVGLLEGPATITVAANGIEAEKRMRVLELKLLRVDVEPPRTVPTTVTPMSDGRVQLSFYPTALGRYEVRSKNNRPMIPARPQIVVRLGNCYPAALLGALMGSVLFVFAVHERSERVPRKRLVLGIVTGLLLAIAERHREFLPAGVPLPSFGESPLLNALWTGFAGGWFGPAFLSGLLGKTLPAPQGGTRPRSAPAVEPAAADLAGH